jgi:hypothetical protein
VTIAARTLETGSDAMSSPEELTFVVGRWLRPVVLVLDVVRRLKAVATSSREQVSTAPHG